MVFDAPSISFCCYANVSFLFLILTYMLLSTYVAPSPILVFFHVCFFCFLAAGVFYPTQLRKVR